MPELQHQHDGTHDQQHLGPQRHRTRPFHPPTELHREAHEDEGQLHDQEEDDDEVTVETDARAYTAQVDQEEKLGLDAEGARRN